MCLRAPWLSILFATACSAPLDAALCTGHTPLQGGSVEDCLSQEHPTFLAAALGAPLAVLHATLHDIAASQTFRAACASVAQLQRAAGSAWRGRLHCSSHVRLLGHGLRVHLWPQCKLLAVPERAGAPLPERHAAQERAETPNAPALGRTSSQPSQKRQSSAAHEAGLQAEEDRPFAAALEVGIKHRELAVADDPDTASLWQAANVAESCPDALPSGLGLDLTTGDLEPVLLVRSLCGCRATAFALAGSVCFGKVQEQIVWKPRY